MGAGCATDPANRLPAPQTQGFIWRSAGPAHLKVAQCHQSIRRSIYVAVETRWSLDGARFDWGRGHRASACQRSMEPATRHRPTMFINPADALIAELNTYRQRHAEESPLVECFINFLSRNGTDGFKRELVEGHLTASCWLVDREKKPCTVDTPQKTGYLGAIRRTR